MKYFSTLFENKIVVHWQTNNFAASVIYKERSSKVNLKNLSKNIYILTRQYNIELKTEWAPRKRIIRADELSKIINYDVWLKAKSFFTTESLWGPQTIDRSADNENTKITYFDSRFWCPGTKVVDTFSVS